METLNDRQPAPPAQQIKPINQSSLFNIQNFTDDEGGVLVMFTPILPDGNLDPSRRPMFRGQVSINNQPVTFNLPQAERLEDCYDLWESAVLGVIEEIRSNIVRAQLMQSESQGRRRQ